LAAVFVSKSKNGGKFSLKPIDVKITSLNIYPIKSCAGIQVEQLEIQKYGPRFDRQWLIVDKNGKFITQRQYPKLACIKTRIQNSCLQINVENINFDFLSDEDFILQNNSSMSVEVWGNQIKAYLEDQKVSQCISDFLGTESFLVRFAADSERFKMDAGLKFADGFPLLLVNQKSLDELNTKLVDKISIDRFRGNIVVDLNPGFSEDNWKFLKTDSGLIFENVKACARCVMITVDQKIGVAISKEPLVKLSEFRRQGNGIMFGINMIHKNQGIIKQDDILRIATSLN
jgi:uncharacterized protein YcbX